MHTMDCLVSLMMMPFSRVIFNAATSINSCDPYNHCLLGNDHNASSYYSLLNCQPINHKGEDVTAHQVNISYWHKYYKSNNCKLSAVMIMVAMYSYFLFFMITVSDHGELLYIAT